MCEYPWTGSRLATLQNMMDRFLGNGAVYCVGIDTRNEPIVVLGGNEDEILERVWTVFKETRPNIYQISWALGWLPEGNYDVVYSDAYTVCENCNRAADIGSDPRFIDGHVLGSGCEIWCDECINAHKDDYIDGFIDNTDFPARYIGDIDRKYLESIGWTLVYEDIDAGDELCAKEYTECVRHIGDHNIYNETLTFADECCWGRVDIYVRINGPIGEYMSGIIDSIEQQQKKLQNTFDSMFTAQLYGRIETYRECLAKLHDVVRELIQ